MSRTISVLCCLMILGLTWALTMESLQGQEPPYVSEQLLVKYKRGVGPGPEVSIPGPLQGSRVVGRFSCLPDWALLQLRPGTSVPDAMRMLGQEASLTNVIERSEPNYLWRAAQKFPNDPLFDNLWALHNTGQEGGLLGADIKALEAWGITRGNHKILIGVLDTGIDFNHPDLMANIWVNPNEIPDNGIDDDNNGYIDDVHGWNSINNTGQVLDDHTGSHGTKVAGIIGAVGNNGIGITGVNWQVQLVALKALDAKGVGRSSDIVSSVCYALRLNEMGYNIRVLSNSWGGPAFSWIISDIIEDTQSDFLFVAAVGNEGVDIGADGNEFYPAAYDIPNIVRVAATTRMDEMWDGSNFGSELVHLAAPGAAILSTTRMGGYEMDFGTSLSAAFVAGVAGLLLSVNADLTVRELKDALIMGGDSLQSMQDRVMSGRRLNALGSLNYMTTAR